MEPLQKHLDKFYPKSIDRAEYGDVLLDSMKITELKENDKKNNRRI